MEEPDLLPRLAPSERHGHGHSDSLAIYYVIEARGRPEHGTQAGKRGADRVEGYQCTPAQHMLVHEHVDSGCGSSLGR